MNPIQHVRVKIFAREPAPIDLGDAIPVFHRWIQERICPEQLIDVADYRHVPAGPGVMLIGHQANYSLDLTKNRLGLLYARKQAGGEAQENLKQAFDAAREACERLEREPAFTGKLRFDPADCEFSINDRLLAPNNGETYRALRPEFERFLAGLWGEGAYAMEHAGEPRELFRIAARRRLHAPC